MDEIVRKEVNLVFRVQGQSRSLPVRRPGDTTLREAAEAALSELNIPVPAGLVARAEESGAVLDLSKSIDALGLKSGDKVLLSWQTSQGSGLGKAGSTRPSLPSPGGHEIHRRYEVPQNVRNETRRHLTAFGSRHLEAVAYWAAEPSGGAWRVARVIVPRFDSTATEVVVSGEANSDVLLQLPESWVIAAQVHSHLGEAFHSVRDDQNAYSFDPDFLSIVVPDGGKGLNEWPGTNRVYRPIGYQMWAELTAEELAERVVIVDA